MLYLIEYNKHDRKNGTIIAKSDNIFELFRMIKYYREKNKNKEYVIKSEKFLTK